MTNKKKETQVLAKVDMQARHAVKQASWIGRSWDTLRLWWSKKDVKDTP